MDDDDDVMTRNGSVSDVFRVSGFLVVSWMMISGRFLLCYSNNLNG